MKGTGFEDALLLECGIFVKDPSTSVLWQPLRPVICWNGDDQGSPSEVKMGDILGNKYR